MTSNSLPLNEEHDVPSQILKTIFDCMPVIFKPQYVWFLTHLCIPMFPDSSGQLAELIVYIIPLEYICIAYLPTFHV